MLLAYSRPARFVLIDRDLLAERWEVEEYIQPGVFGNPIAALRALRRTDVVVCWFASWHAFWPVTLAWLTRKPSLLIVGGFDTANVPEIGYGYQQGGVRRLLARWVMRRATLLMTNSEYSRSEIEQNVGSGTGVVVVYHGIPDPFGDLPRTPREPIALTVSTVARISIERKGLRAFVAAGADVPEVEFVLVGHALDDAADVLRGLAAPNVRIAGRLSDEELDDLYRRAAVYVQASRHEGFGMAVAEAMLGGCIPVVTRVGALPEVVGDTGVWIDGSEPAEIAAGVRRALELDDDVRRRARERIVTRFPLERRREGLQRLVEGLLGRAAPRDRRA